MKKLLFGLLSCFALNAYGTVYLEPSPQFKPRFDIAALYIEDGDRLLFLHRQENKSQGNRWGIPGGKVDKNETPLQAIIREVKEETGYDFSDQPIQFLKTVYVEHNEKDHITYHMFRTTLPFDPSAVKINFNEHKGFTWITVNDALKYELIDDEDHCIKMTHGAL
jgi:8-oxo-dGTP diphosphatase